MTIAFLHAQTPARRRQRTGPARGGFTVDASTRDLGTSRHTLVTVRGEVDAANVRPFALAVGAALSDDAAAVTLDLSELAFIAVDGIAALHAINARLARSDTPWQVLPSGPVRRVLELCDPAGLIPRPDADAAEGAIA